MLQEESMKEIKSNILIPIRLSPLENTNIGMFHVLYRNCVGNLISVSRMVEIYSLFGAFEKDGNNILFSLCLFVKFIFGIIET